VSNDEHVPEIESYIRTIKELTRSVYTSLSFKKFRNQPLVEIVYAQVFWLNAFPAINGILDQRSPQNITTGATIEYHLHCQLEFGSYVQTNEAHGNNMQPRTIGAIALQPTGNVQGGFYFYNLSTGDIISQRSWTPLHIPKDVINRVHELAAANEVS